MNLDEIKRTIAIAVLKDGDESDDSKKEVIYLFAASWIPDLINEVDKLRDQLCEAESELEELKNEKN